MQKPNAIEWLPIFRIVTAPLLIVLAINGHKDLFKWILMVSLLTDAVDGYLARKLKMSRPQGAILDSWGDMLALLAGLVGFFLFERDFVMENLVWISIALGLYVLQLLLAVFRYGKPSSFHTYMAKTAAVVQGVFLCSTFFFGVQEWLFWIMIGIAVIECLEETLLIFFLPEWKADVKGLIWVLKERS